MMNIGETGTETKILTQTDTQIVCEKIDNDDLINSKWGLEVEMSKLTRMVYFIV